jgi:hypothetical protein
MLGFGQDLEGAPVPQGSGPDLGALEYPNLSAAEPAPAATLAAMSARPNPFNPITTLEFTLDRAGLATLEIFSLDGRRVRRLLADWRPAGPGRAVWDGRDDRGRPLPSSAYLARLRSSGTVAVCHLLLVK